MHTEKLSISLSPTMFSFIEHYQKIHHCKSRSEVVSHALRALQSLELESAYQEASLECDPLWENTISDGLTHETW
ncbi:MAG: CopG family transcriptional regulator [Gammaproteobacteria bacterium]|nr:CopG family transcriptional regulator [Gammaproteobacteria bacterium]